MVVILGASSLNHAINRLSGKTKKLFRKTVVAIPGLSLNYNAINKRKTVQFQLNNPLKNVDVILWHDLINNSITAHANNNNCPISLEKLLQIIKSIDNRIKAIIYCQRHGTSNIYNRLKDLPVVIVDIIKDILPRRKVRERQIVEKYKSLHLEPKLEYSLLSVVFKFINNPERIILQKRPKNLISVDVWQGKGRIEVRFTFRTSSWASSFC